MKPDAESFDPENIIKKWLHVLFHWEILVS